MLIVGGYLEDSKISYEICKKDNNLYSTVGIHPCRANVKIIK
jgi:Tat protein secretion system quality control protein TatD with DNase activity